MIYFSQYSTHSVLLRFQCRFRSERYYPGCSPPQPAARHVKSVVPKSGKVREITKRKTVTTNTQPRYKNCQPKAVTGRIGCTSGQTRWCMQKITLRKEGFLFGGKEKEVREPARPISACTILILCNSHKHASKKAKRNPLAPNDRSKGFSL